MHRFRSILTASAVTAAAACIAAAAIASETITYAYDAQGRLVKVERVNDQTSAKATTDYSHDKADNRTNKSVTKTP